MSAGVSRTSACTLALFFSPFSLYSLGTTEKYSGVDAYAVAAEIKRRVEHADACAPALKHPGSRYVFSIFSTHFQTTQFALMNSQSVTTPSNVP